ncbi:MAG: ABC transporter permease [Bacteroidales bacterium]|nr:ABC transporter permease [Bacteroidales bacterium]
MNTILFENIRIAVESIRSHLLRTILTVLIIGFGIMALVGILTAIDSLKYFLAENFMMMGANTMSIRNRSVKVQVGGHSRPEYYKLITYEDAKRFRDLFEYPSYVSIFVYASNTATLKYESEKTNPNIPVVGSDENYIITAGYELLAGRNFSINEINFGASLAIIGSDLSASLFDNHQDAVGKIVSIGAGKYRIIGILKEKGSSLGFSGDKICILPLNNVMNYFSRPNMSYTINIMTNTTESLDPAKGEATGLFRMIRKLRLNEEDNFDIVMSDNIVEQLIDNMKYITVAATIIGLITLFGAAIGLMNIMLVSVTERTHEIGIRKAMGATRGVIKRQFLAEAIVVGQLGGLLGIVLGIMVGNILSLILGTNFIIPWIWILLGVILCFIVALVSGIYPAVKASKLDPIESLRFE